MFGRVLEVKTASRRSKNEPKTAEDGFKLETPLGERSDQDESTWVAYEVLFRRCRDSSRWLPKKIYS